MEYFPDLLLGTAMWGWTIPREQCFLMLDQFYASGFRQVDTATNYPINKVEADFRKAERILRDWIVAHGVGDLKVTMKVGSVDNQRTPDHNLSKSFLLICLDEYLHLFGSNLDTLMIHWDNRTDEQAIRSSLEALAVAAGRGVRPGLSGILHPEIYARLNSFFSLDFRIQIKHNLLYSDYRRYRSFHGYRRFIPYGITAGGVKLDPSVYHGQSSLVVRGGSPQTEVPLITGLRDLLANTDQGALPEPVSEFFQVGMIFAFHHPDIEGLLTGPSTPAQLMHTIAFFRALESGAYLPLFDALETLRSSYE